MLGAWLTHIYSRAYAVLHRCRGHVPCVVMLYLNLAKRDGEANGRQTSLSTRAPTETPLSTARIPLKSDLRWSPPPPRPGKLGELLKTKSMSEPHSQQHFIGYDLLGGHCLIRLELALPSTGGTASYPVVREGYRVLDSSTQAWRIERYSYIRITGHCGDGRNGMGLVFYVLVSWWAT